MPPESCQGYLSPKPPSPTEASSASPRATYSALLARKRRLCGSTTSSGSRMLSSVVRQGISVGAWKAMPTPRIGPFTACPCTRTSPRVGGSSPVTSFIRVDLPQPDGPTTAMNSPLAMESVASSSACMRLDPLP